MTTAVKRPTKSDSKVNLQEWALVEALLDTPMDRILLYGPPGLGKTYSALKHGRQPEQVINCYLSEETPAYDLIGHDVVVDGNMIWRDGPAIMAWRKGYRLILNEIDQASGDALDALTAILDDPESAGYTLPNGERVEPAEGFQAVATMNGEPERLPEKLADRLTCRVHVVRPHPGSILALPKRLQDLATTLTDPKVAEARRCTIRQFRSFAKLCELGVNETIAAETSFHDQARHVLTALKAKAVPA